MLDQIRWMGPHREIQEDLSTHLSHTCTSSQTRTLIDGVAKTPGMARDAYMTHLPIAVAIQRGGPASSLSGPARCSSFVRFDNS